VDTWSIVFNPIAHAYLAWGPFLTAAFSPKINGFINWSYRYGFTNNTICEVQLLLDNAVHDLFAKIQSPDHCTGYIHCCQAQTSLCYRPIYRGRVVYELPSCTYNLHKQSYIVNCFNFCDVCSMHWLHPILSIVFFNNLYLPWTRQHKER